MADLLKGINVRNALKQIGSFGAIDADVFDNWSVAGGARSPAKGKVVGRTVPKKGGNAGDTVTAQLLSDPDYSGSGNYSSRSTSGGGGGDADAAMRNMLKGKISGRGGEIEAIYQALFGDLEGLVRARDAELESEYGGQFKKASDTYTEAIPQIDASYAALGAYDSTNRGDARTKADKGFKDTTETIGKNKKTDKAKLGQYKTEQSAKFSADKDSALRAINSANETTDVGALRGLDNDLAGNISQAGVTRATLGSDAGARGEISRLTGDNGRFEAAVNALDGIIKSSMSGAVKEAAVKAVTDAGGLSDDEKKKVQETYGNVYAEQQAL